METITLSLVSHTNVGKTTLARTLLRRDVGEVLDHAHVTEVAEAHELLVKDGARLVLWDTPGFGDSARLMRRLKRHKTPIGWFLHEVWDRNRDRPLWCSQEAIRNIRNDADVVLYLVNAAEEPEDAGYVRHELEILSWTERPVLLVLNQTGAPGTSTTELEETWRRFARAWACVRDVLPLDAFSRSWIQEGVLFDHIVELLPEAQRPLMRRLAREWKARGHRVFETCMLELAAHLARAATDRVVLERGKVSALGRRRAMTALAGRLIVSERGLWDAIIVAHGLDGRAAAEVKQRIEDFEVEGQPVLSVKKGAIIGGAVSGAISGLVADVMAGGLTFGGGLVAGTILGALGGAGLSQGLEWLRGSEEPTVRWSAEFLDASLRRVVLRYMAVAHFGRGRGEFRDVEQPAHWVAAVEAAAQKREAAWTAAWAAGSREGDAHRASLAQSLATDLEELVLSVLESAPA